MFIMGSYGVRRLTEFALTILHTQHECVPTAALDELGSGVHDLLGRKH